MGCAVIAKVSDWARGCPTTVHKTHISRPAGTMNLSPFRRRITYNVMVAQWSKCLKPSFMTHKVMNYCRELSCIGDARYASIKVNKLDMLSY